MILRREKENKFIKTVLFMKGILNKDKGIKAHFKMKSKFKNNLKIKFNKLRKRKN